ncbi:MAG: hypothetical protein P5702_17695 [Limnospira sp. PMC 1291.21]|uniref:Uncharacterized protein n=3 Tax=Limnospira TaxID=2596745 RepID=A0A9P1KBY5_9CYAN|nr:MULTISPECIES: hypothetical protein [Limnospira]MBD2670906.1 hypothetical protein [Arthrospira platensis FACHB-439]MDC0836277.1 hypothetical protein [Limnoraphis robusta]MDT9184356.1 hypothetical protein [Limnospira sp. PMC 289.06]QJB28126.1 hypothetical protein HFV01_23000 [Limnospira fusiformis SAG 85.79]EDZ95009.1 hypothetical protein AmaxDRAFT_2187 [Limnospira maxima CS-328]
MAEKDGRVILLATAIRQLEPYWQPTKKIKTDVIREQEQTPCYKIGQRGLV